MLTRELKSRFVSFKVSLKFCGMFTLCVCVFLWDRELTATALPWVLLIISYLYWFVINHFVIFNLFIIYWSLMRSDFLLSDMKKLSLNDQDIKTRSQVLRLYNVSHHCKYYRMNSISKNVINLNHIEKCMVKSYKSFNLW